MSRNFVRFVIVGVALSVTCVSARTPKLCGENEQLGNCGRICEGKCGNPDLSKCAATSCAGSDCQCESGFLRNSETDLCVRPSQCPSQSCGAHEILAACGRTCEGTCEHPFRPEICKRIKCSTQRCQCDLSNGYVRDPDTDECVHKDDKCCAAKLKCPSNSEPRICGGVCEPTCSNPAEIFCKLDPKNCVIGCHCSKGYVRNEETGECVKRSECGCNSDTSEDSQSSESSDESESD